MFYFAGCYQSLIEATFSKASFSTMSFSKRSHVLWDPKACYRPTKRRGSGLTAAPLRGPFGQWEASVGYSTVKGVHTGFHFPFPGAQEDRIREHSREPFTNYDCSTASTLIRLFRNPSLRNTSFFRHHIFKGVLAVGDIQILSWELIYQYIRIVKSVEFISLIGTVSPHVYYPYSIF